MVCPIVSRRTKMVLLLPLLIVHKSRILYQNAVVLYPDQKHITICADIEDQITDLKPEERSIYMQNIGLEKTGLDQLIITGYGLL